MKIHKMTLYFIDHDNLGIDAIAGYIRDHKYINATPPTLAQTIQVIDWDDSHPMNQKSTDKDAWWSSNYGLPL